MNLLGYPYDFRDLMKEIILGSQRRIRLWLFLPEYTQLQIFLLLSLSLKNKSRLSPEKEEENDICHVLDRAGL